MDNLNYIDYTILGFSGILLVLLIVLGRKLLITLEQSAKDKEELIASRTNLENAQYTINENQLQINELNETLNINRNELTKYNSENHSLSNDVNRLSRELSALQEKNAADEQKIVALSQDNSSLKTQLDAQKELLNHQLESFEKAQDEKQKLFDTSYKELQEQLKLMGNNLVKAGTEDLSKNSKEQMTLVVNPLKEELEKLKNHIAKAQETNAERQGALTKEIKILEESHSTLSKQAEELAKALRSGGKSQGMWGELQLERVLDASGLQNGIEYEREVAGDRSLNEKGRPDAVIKLPDNHNIIVDAKCSLSAFTNYINAESDDDKKAAMKAHIESIRSHIKELIKKDYSSYQSLNSPSFVFMFVPIDSALMDAINYDATLYDYAVQNRVYLVSPSSILPALRVVSNLWILAEQSEKMRHLADAAQKIYDKFENITKAFDAVNSAKSKLNENLDTLQGRLYTGKGNLQNLISSFDTKARKELSHDKGAIIDSTQAVNELEFVDDSKN